MEDTSRRFAKDLKIHPNMTSMMAPIMTRDVNNSAPEIMSKPKRIESAIVYPNKIDRDIDN
jgi:hypothetical protein